MLLHGAVGTGLTRADLTEALIEHDKRKEEDSVLKMSEVSEGIIAQLLASLDLVILDFAFPDHLSSMRVDGYNWMGKDEDDTVAFSGAYCYLKTMLDTAGVIFAPDHYQLVDVHSFKSYLILTRTKKWVRNCAEELVLLLLRIPCQKYPIQLSCVCFLRSKRLTA